MLDASYRGTGLFAHVDGGTVKNLTIDGCSTTLTAATGSQLDIGAVSGASHSGTFSNITLNNITFYGGTCTGSLIGDALYDDADFNVVENCTATDVTIYGGAVSGGLIGRAHAYNIISDCTVTNVTVSGTERIGGFAGAILRDGSVNNCHANQVTVTATGTDSSGTAGGFSASLASPIENSSASGTVTANASNAVGGLVAYLENVSKVNACHADVAVTGRGSVGGLIGYTSGGNPVLTDCYATGNVVATSKNGNNGVCRVGGLVGYLGGSATNCFAMGDVTVTSNETTTKEPVVGGLLGSTSPDVMISGCYATGNVSSEVTCSSGSYGMGGLVGRARGTYTNCYAAGTVSGISRVGGFAGSIDGGPLTDCYAIGNVTGSSSSVGGFVGYFYSEATVNTAAASGNVSADTYAGGFVGTFMSGTIQNALSSGTVTAGEYAGAFVGLVANEKQLYNCYAASSTVLPFTGSYPSGYYKPTNCFFTGSVTGMLDGKSPNPTYSYAKVTFSADGVSANYGGEIPSFFTQENTISSENSAPVQTLAVKSDLIDDDGKATVDGTGTIGLYLTVNGVDFLFGSASLTVTGKTISAPAFVWADDYSFATVSFTDGDEIETENTTVTSETVNSTCTTAGTVTYTATFSYGGKTYTDIKSEGIPSIGHSYGVPTWAWTGYTAATATFTCEQDDDTQIVAATITSEVTTAATYGAPGVRTYMATVTFNGTDYTDTATEAIPQLVYIAPATPTTTIEDSETPLADIADEEVPLAGMTFVDVLPASWYYESVNYVFGKGLMNGTSDTTFDPDATSSRAMVATILYRLADKPDVESAISFADVADTDYYAEAAAWAEENGIFIGFDDGTFRGSDAITREQLAAVLYRYAVLNGYAASGADALEWAVESGLLQGDENGLNPTGVTTRAMLATVLMRYVENIVK